MYDFHMHSNFSADSDTPMEEMVKEAIKKGLKEICFTEHIDEDYPDRSISFDLPLADYHQALKDMQSLYGDRIAIRKGVELGGQPHVLPSYRKLLEMESFDFIIFSMHAVKGMDLHSGKFFEGKSVEQAYEAYYTELLECITDFPQFHILGHLDLVARYKNKEGTDSFLEIIEEIFRLIIPSGKGIEVNTSGYFYGLNRMMPSEDILKLYKEMNGEIITFGSDAHSPERIGEYYVEATESLKRIGFRYITTFEGGKPIFHKL